MYAAGFLYGHAKGLSHRQSGEIGALLSGKVIPDLSLPNLVRSYIACYQAINF